MDTAGVSRTTCAVITADAWFGATVMQSPAEALAPTLSALLARAGFTMADVTHVVAGIGPGPFTGLRIGLAHAHATAHALGVPVSGVSSLAAVAHRLPPADRPDAYVVATDARRKEVYAAIVDTNANLVGPPQVIAPAQLAAQLAATPVGQQSMVAVGDGAIAYADVFEAAGLRIADGASLMTYEEALVAATRQALEGSLLPAMPEYMREPDAVPSAAVSANAPAVAPAGLDTAGLDNATARASEATP